MGDVRPRVVQKLRRTLKFGLRGRDRSEQFRLEPRAMIAAFVKEVEVHYLCCVKINGSLIHYVPNKQKFKISMLD